MADTASLTARITELESRMAAFAGIRATQFENQNTTFDYEAAEKELSRLRAELTAASGATSSRTRYLTVAKGV